MFCFRAIESLMQHFLKGDPTDRTARTEAWVELDKDLNVTKNFTNKISKYALTPRHGKFIPLSISVRIELLKRTQSVIDRFVVFAKNNEKPLDKKQYPEL